MTAPSTTESTLDRSTAAADADAGEPVTTDDRSDAALVVDELLVEEISIDGMCGVY